MRQDRRKRPRMPLEIEVKNPQLAVEFIKYYNELYGTSFQVKSDTRTPILLVSGEQSQQEVVVLAVELGLHLNK